MTLKNPGDVFVGFRGTKNVKDMLIDAFAALEKVEMHSYNFHAHKGIRMAIKSKIPAINAVLAQRKADKQLRSVTLTGHSLGGAYAVLVYSMLRGKSFKKTKNSDFSSKTYLDVPMEVYTYGAPNILGRKGGWNNDLKANDANVHNFIHNYDLVPRLLGTKTLATMIKTLLKVMPPEMQKARELLDGFADNRVLNHMSEYYVYGHYYFLRSLREKGESGEVYETKFKCSHATTLKDKKRIALIPYPEMTKFGIVDAVHLLIPDHGSKKYVAFFQKLLEQD